MIKLPLIATLFLIIASTFSLCAGKVSNLDDQRNGSNSSQNSSQTAKSPVRSYPEIGSYRVIPIAELKDKKIHSGEYNIEGFVVKIYTCPPCPPGANCKPCMKDNIVVSTNNRKLETYSLSHQEVILFGKDVQQFKMGEKYRFSIKVTNEKTTGETINDLELLGYSTPK